MRKFLTVSLAAWAPFAGPATALGQRPGAGALDALVLPRAGRMAHYSSWDRQGRNDDFRRIAPGETVTLVDHRGAGIVRRWWITIAPRNDRAIQRQLIVRCYWDDEAEPSVEVPVSDFFGVGFGEWHDYVSLPLNMTSGGYNSYWAMPFRRRARITVENRSSVTIDRFYYNVDVEAVGALPDSALYFHAQFRRATAGTLRLQDMGVFESDSATWSGGVQLWCVESRPGARLHSALGTRHSALGTRHSALGAGVGVGFVVAALIHQGRAEGRVPSAAALAPLRHARDDGAGGPSPLSRT